MNPTTTQPPPPSLPPPSLPPPPPQLQPHRPSTSCDRHPQENFTGFCPSCLCERLAVLDPNSSSSSAAARKPPSSSAAAAALKTIFRSSVASRRPPPSSLPELRRTKSFSASKNEALSGFFEPQRKSCDVRGRSTLFTLFNQEAEVETRHLPSSSVVQKPVLESKEEDDDDDEDEEKDNIVVHDVTDIKVPESSQPQPANAETRVSEIVEEESETVPEPAEADVADEEALKAMKDHMDLDSQTKKTSGRDLKGSFWSAASVFSKKLQKWRQKMKKRERNGVVVGSGTLLPVEKPISRQFRETQSEIADYGFGRRSCDTDPRFSLDAARMSFDFEEPRASWDGYLMARTAPTFAVPPRMPTMIEDAPAPVQVLRTDSLIPVEEPEYEETLTLNLNQNINFSVNHNVNTNPNLPGGSNQTREYYSDSSSRRRKSLDRSSSIRRTAAAVVAEMDELKSVSNASATTNAKVTPAASADYVHNPLRDSNLNSNSLRDDGCEKGASKKSSSRWSKAWSIWGLIHRRGSKEEDGGGNGNGNGNGVERSYSESWQEYRGGERNGDVRGGGFNPKMIRSNSSVSWRNGQGLGGGGFGSVSMRKSDVQGNGLGLGLGGGGGGGGGGRKGRDEFVGLERNRSARYSPNSIDNNGLLRLYLGGRRNGSGKGRSNQAHSIARSVLRLY